MAGRNGRVHLKLQRKERNEQQRRGKKLAADISETAQRKPGELSGNISRRS